MGSKGGRQPTKRIHTGPSWLAGGQNRPLRRPGDDLEISIEWGHARTERFKQQVRRDHALLHCHGGLEKPRNPGGAFGVADDGLDAADKQLSLGSGASYIWEKGRGYGIGLLWVASRSSRAWVVKSAQGCWCLHLTRRSSGKRKGKGGGETAHDNNKKKRRDSSSRTTHHEPQSTGSRPHPG